LVDIAPYDDTDPAEQAVKIVNELEKYNAELASKPRWLVVNKVDLLAPEEVAERIEHIKTALRSEEHTSELQSRENLVCRLLLESIVPLRHLHSFPTRRSSDLPGGYCTVR